MLSLLESYSFPILYAEDTDTRSRTHTKKVRDNPRMLFKKPDPRTDSFRERVLAKGGQRLGRGPICSNNAEVTGRIGT